MACFSSSGSLLMPPIVAGFIVFCWAVLSSRSCVISCLLFNDRLSNSRFAFSTAGFVTFCNGGAFVVSLLAFCQSDLDFGASILQIDADRHHGHAFDANVIPQFADLLFVQEQAPSSARFMIEAVGLFVGRDM